MASCGSETAAETSGAAILLLFEKGTRPDIGAIRQAIAGSRAVVSCEPAAALGGNAWLEMLLNGLTFDCLGLEPGPGVPYQATPNLLQLPHEAIAACEAVALMAGPHCAAAAHTLPVLRTQMEIAAALLDLPGLCAVTWAPARLALSPAAFRRLIESWLNGGAFPSLAMVSFKEDNRGRLVSEGLAFLTGQELCIAAEAADGPAGAVRLAARLVHDLVASQKLTGEVQVTNPDGRSLLLRPDAGGLRIHVLPG